MRVLFGRDEKALAGLAGGTGGLDQVLPGWEVRGCPPAELPGHLDGVDVVVPIGAVVDRDVLAAGTFGLVQQFGVGLDTVDVDAATEHGVLVARLPAGETGNAEAVAEVTLLHVLAQLRRYDAARAAFADGRWGEPVGRSLAGATVVVAGLGDIGREVVARLRGFGARVLAVRAHPERGGVDGVERVVGPDRLADVLAEADVVVCSAMFETGAPPLFDRAAFAATKRGAVFVNVARGGLVDEAALLDALDDGTLAGAGLDVFATEPADPYGRLVRHPRVTATPHVGGLTGAMLRRSLELFAANLRAYENGDRPRWTVNDPERVR